MAFIATRSGFFDLAQPRPEDVRVTDVAWALAHLPRWGGHARMRWSVASHSMLVAAFVPAEHRLAALVHDMPEAYCQDLMGPLRRLVGEAYEGVYRRVERACFDAVGIGSVPEKVQQVDARVLHDEWLDLFDAAQHATWRPTASPLGVNLPTLEPDPKAVAREWLAMVEQLSGASAHEGRG